MKIALFLSLGLAAFFLTPAVAAPLVSPPSPPPSPAAAPVSTPATVTAPSSAPTPAPANWTTTDGKVYQNVTVVKTEPDAVTITDHDGGARVPLANLPPDLQKHFNYDPAKAKAAADARAQDDAKNAKALQAEMDLAQIRKREAMAATDPRGPFPSEPIRTRTTTSVPDDATADDTSTPAATEPPTIVTSTGADPLADGPSGPTHHSMDDLVDINSRLKDDHPSPNRHTMSSLLLASSYLMPDPLDPNHHSTDELLKSASVMIPPTDTGNRHSMDSLFGNDPLQHP